MPAAVAPMVSPDRRASAYGLFTAIYGTGWVVGSVTIGALFDVSLGAVTAFAVACQVAAVPFIADRPPADGGPVVTEPQDGLAEYQQRRLELADITGHSCTSCTRLATSSARQMYASCSPGWPPGASGWQLSASSAAASRL